MIKLILYQTDFCHLCDEAASLVHLVLEGKSAEMKLVDISLDSQLIGQYATLIPVLAVEGRPELQLNWPFSREDIIGLLTKVGE